MKAWEAPDRLGSTWFLWVSEGITGGQLHSRWAFESRPGLSSLPAGGGSWQGGGYQIGGRLKVPPGLEVGQGWGGENDVRAAACPTASFFPIQSLPCASPIPHSLVGWGWSGGRWAEAVCFSPKPGSCADESRLNREPQAVLSRPALTHLPPKSPHLRVPGLPLPGGSMPGAPRSQAPSWRVSARCPQEPHSAGLGLRCSQVLTQPEGSFFLWRRTPCYLCPWWAFLPQLCCP